MSLPSPLISPAAATPATAAAAISPSTATPATATAAIHHIAIELSLTRCDVEQLGDKISKLSNDVTSMSIDVRRIALLLRNIVETDATCGSALSPVKGQSWDTRSVQTGLCLIAPESEVTSNVVPKRPRFGILKTSKVFSTSMSISPTNLTSLSGEDFGHHKNSNQQRRVEFSTSPTLRHHIRPSQSSVDITISSNFRSSTPECAVNPLGQDDPEFSNKRRRKSADMWLEHCDSAVLNTPDVCSETTPVSAIPISDIESNGTVQPHSSPGNVSQPEPNGAPVSLLASPVTNQEWLSSPRFSAIIMDDSSEKGGDVGLLTEICADKPPVMFSLDDSQLAGPDLSLQAWSGFERTIVAAPDPRFDVFGNVGPPKNEFSAAMANFLTTDL